ncbi:protein GLUTAMINE DUMPER 3-like [Rhododendron vialii]|uniref:protein GLUTAMINE DUMPER 3-like n=1 Tax=Rhododendron vialii TaxID=182163 RepID=UPI0026604591|nr:protein GLUTAMINE DUMPER 3-like [Rhododendron vialii]
MYTEVSHIPTASPVQRSPWHSPVPYLFGGLAAMLGLIAFALLILACSYWKLSGYLENNSGDGNSGDRDLELGEANSDEKPKLPPVVEEKFLVIMAGQEKPTFIATPISSRASSFGSNCSSCGGGSSSSSSSSEMSEKTEDGEDGKEKLKQGSGLDQVQVGNTENHEASDQIP